ncbi:hypothetical protein ES706_01236 [subsurface metagenome]|nr:hypothetical protein [Hadesarchaea archaeon]
MVGANRVASTDTLAHDERSWVRILRNRVSFYKSLNRMVGLGIVGRYRDPGVRGLVYKLSKSEVVVDLKGGKVRVI